MDAQGSRLTEGVAALTCRQVRWPQGRAEPCFTDGVLNQSSADARFFGRDSRAVKAHPMFVRV